MDKINIAIDGPVGCGKSTTAKALAKKLNYNFLDTGVMYRAIAYYLHNKKILAFDVLETNLIDIKLDFDSNNEIFLNNENIHKIVKTDFYGKLASDYGSNPIIRNYLVKIQKEIVKNRSYIAEGRDMALVVMPDAELKIYLTASVEERAKRRLKDAIEKGENYSFEEMKRMIEERDFQDMNRKISPLMKANDAIELDTSNLSIEEQVETIYNLVKKILDN